MNLTENPFFTIGATTRDNRRQLSDLAEDRKLTLDPESCSRALSDLLHPARRLAAETAWLPGIAPRRASELLSNLDCNPGLLFAQGDLPPLPRVNLMAEAIRRTTQPPPVEAVKWILVLSYEFERVDANTTKSFVNEDRIAAGIPEVEQDDVIIAALEERRRYLKTVLSGLLERLGKEASIQTVSAVLTNATNAGQEVMSTVIQDLVDSYEISVKNDLYEQGQKVEALLQAIRTDLESKASDSTLERMVGEIETAVRRWDRIAQPIQLGARSRGAEHGDTTSLGMKLRSLSLDFWNKYDKLSLSKRLTELMVEAFAEDRVIVEVLEQDKKALANISKEQAESEARKAAWRQEVTWQTEMGLIFKDRLGISPDGVRWNSQTWKLEDISSISFGGVKHSINGIPTGTRWHIGIHGKDNSARIEVSNSDVYEAFTSRLMRTVGVRLMFEYSSRLQAGEKLTFGTAVLDDQGIELEKYKLFGKNPRTRFTWDQVTVWIAPGSFCIGCTQDRGFIVTLSYIESGNTHVLEMLIRAAFKKGASRLSDAFSE
jgi:hypothetical protein